MQKSLSAKQALASPQLLPSESLEKAKELVGQWPHANPPDKARWLTSIAATFSGYPSAIVDACCDPRGGLAKVREFPPTIACIVEWCDQKMKDMQVFASYKPIAPKLPAPDYSNEHRQGMLQKLSSLMHGLLKAKEHLAWVRPRGRFEQPGDQWERKPAPAKPNSIQIWKPYTVEELRERYPARESAKADL